MKLGRFEDLGLQGSRSITRELNISPPRLRWSFFKGGLSYGRSTCGSFISRKCTTKSGMLFISFHAPPTGCSDCDWKVYSSEQGDTEMACEICQILMDTIWMNGRPPAFLDTMGGNSVDSVGHKLMSPSWQISKASLTQRNKWQCHDWNLWIIVWRKCNTLKKN